MARMSKRTRDWEAKKDRFRKTRDDAYNVGGGSGGLANYSDTDIRLTDSRRRLNEAKKDRRYRNPDGSAKTGGEVALGFERSEGAQKKVSYNNKMKQFSYISDDIMSQKPDENGFVELKDSSVSMLQSIFPGFRGNVSSKKTFKEGFDPDDYGEDEIFYARNDDGNINIYAGGKKLDIMSPTKETVDASAKLGYILRKQDEAMSNQGNQQITNFEEERIKTARNAIKSIDDNIVSFIKNDSFVGSSEQMDYIEKLEASKIDHEELLKSITQKKQTRTPYDSGVLKEGLGSEVRNRPPQVQPEQPKQSVAPNTPSNMQTNKVPSIRGYQDRFNTREYRANDAMELTENEINSLSPSEKNEYIKMLYKLNIDKQNQGLGKYIRTQKPKGIIGGR